jgi:hypothetical protein
MEAHDIPLQKATSNAANVDTAINKQCVGGTQIVFLLLFYEAVWRC